MNDVVLLAITFLTAIGLLFGGNAVLEYQENASRYALYQLCLEHNQVCPYPN